MALLCSQYVAADTIEEPRGAVPTQIAARRFIPSHRLSAHLGRITGASSALPAGIRPADAGVPACLPRGAHLATLLPRDAGRRFLIGSGPLRRNRIQPGRIDTRLRGVHSRGAGPPFRQNCGCRIDALDRTADRDEKYSCGADAAYDWVILPAREHSIQQIGSTTRRHSIPFTTQDAGILAGTRSIFAGISSRFDFRERL
jgi:hypothetical protein